MVSTDDEEIAEVARACGAKTPFVRSAEAASEFATTSDVLHEVLDEYRKVGINPALMCCIYPTAPLLQPETLTSALGILLDDPLLPGVLPVSRFSFPIQRALRIEDGRVSFVTSEHRNTRSQDLEPAYHDAGQFYWLRVSNFLAPGSVIPDGFAGFALPAAVVQDIDNEEDWLLAEMKWRLLNRHPNTT
jgi:pseudaminic acid cytidylyltransferase